MKKWFGCLFVFVLLCCALTMRVEAESVSSGTCGPSLTWSLDSEGTLTISGTGPMYDYTYQTKAVHITMYITTSAPWGWETVNEVIIESGVTYIGANAFRSNFSEYAYDFESSLSHGRCKINIASVEIPNTVTGVGENAFLGNNAIYSTYDNGMYVGIGSNPYAVLVDTVSTSITSCDIHEDTKMIAGKAFQKCNSLTNIFIPAGVTSISQGVFDQCTGLTKIEVAADSLYYRNDEKGVLFNKNITQLLKAPVNLSGEYQIPNGVRTVYSGAFERCRGLTSVVIPDSVTELGEKTFYYCTGLNQVAIGNGVTKIGRELFYYCSGLREITIGNGVTEIEQEAFAWCSSLREIVIPSSVEYIGERVFYGCKSLESMTIPFVGDCRKTSENIYQYPFGYLFGTYSYSGATATTQPYYCYTLTGTISGTYYIPSGLKSVKVTGGGILYGAFYNCKNLTSVMITDGVTEIGENAFYNCTGLTYHVYNNAKYLGTDETPFLALIECTSTGITSYTIHQDTKIIGSSAFKNCGNLVSITIPEGLKSISSSAFEGKSKLFAIQIPASVESIGRFAFKGCSSLKRIIIPDGVTHIRSAAFEGCSALVEVVLPNSIQKIDASAFSGCSSLAEVNLPDGVTSIGESAFSGCSSLTVVNLPDGVTSIGNTAFSGCSGLTEVNLPDSVTSIGESVFSGCSSLQSMTIPFVGDCKKTASETYQYPFGYLFGTTSYTGGVATTQRYYDSRLDSTSGKTYYIPGNLKSVTVTGGEILCGAFYYCRNLTSITLPEDITEIGTNAFYYCSGLTEIVIPAGVTKIGESAFYSCNKLRTVAIPEGITAISRRMFYSCTGLQEIVIHEGIVSIGEEAFYGCSKLTGIQIPSSVSTIGALAFTKCSKLTGFAVSADNLYFSNNADGLLLNKEMTTILYAPGGLAGSYTVPDYITTISTDAFSNCKLLTEIIVPDSVTTIGAAAFRSCSKLQSLTVPFVGKGRRMETDREQYPLGYLFGWSDTDDGVATGQYYYNNPSSSRNYQTFYIPESLTSVTVTDGDILYGAFYNCSNLKSITVQDGITKIGGSAFYGCSGLTEFTIPDSVTAIGESAFSGCTGLSEVHITDLAAWCKIDFGDKEANPLYYARLLYVNDQLIKQFVISDRITVLKDFVFYNCYNITELVLPENLTAIGSMAFESCSRLKTIHAGAQLQTIGNRAFCDCDLLETLNYSGTKQQWEAVEIGAQNEPLRMAEVVYTQRQITGISIQSAPTKQEYFIGEELDLSGLVVMALRTDGISEVVTEGYTVSGYDSTTTGEKIIKVSYEDFTATFTVWVKIGGSCGDNLTWTLDQGVLTISGIGAMYDFKASAYTEGYWFLDEYAYRFIIHSTAPWCNRKIDKVVIEPGVTTIGDNAFWHSTREEQVLASSYENYNITETEVFSSVEIPDSVTKIGKCAFRGQTLITAITIPDGVTSIGDYAFSDCSDLETIHMGAQLQSIGREAFYGCDMLETLYYSGTKGQWNAIYKGSGNEALVVAELICFEAPITGISIQSAPTKQEYFIGEELDLSGLVVKSLHTDGTDEVITNGYTVSGYDATTLGVQTITVTYENFTATFTVCVKNGGDCGEKLNWTLSDDGTLTITGTGAMTDFANSKAVSWYLMRDKVKKVVIEEGVTSIGKYAFSYCTSLEEITIASSVTAIGSYAFEQTHALQQVQLPSGLQTMGSYLFYRSEGLLSIVIPDSVTALGASAFSRCINLKQVTIGTGITKLERYTFFTCTSLTSVTIPNNITVMGDQVFENCSALSTITLSSNLKSIGQKSFSGCTALRSVYYRNTAEKWGQLTIGDANELLFAAQLFTYGEMPLNITGQPESVQAQVGETVTFTVIAEGDGLSYKWQYMNAGGTSWSNTSQPGAKTNTLILYDVQGSVHHGRRYRCVITDSYGNTVSSEAATLSVAYLARDAKSQSVQIGENAVFTVNYSITEGVTYRWEYKGNAASSTWANTTATGNRTNTLTVQGKATNNRYMYRCKITLSDGTVITSKEVYLNIVEDLPVITANPVDASAVCGDYAVFTVEAEGDGLSYQWQFYNPAVGVWTNTKGSGYDTATLRVKTNNFNSGYMYRCCVKTLNGSGTNKVYSEAATMTVLPAAEINEPLPETITAKVGDTIQIHIGAEGEGLTYQWQWAKFKGNWKNTSLTGATTDTLTVANVRADMNGRYYRVVITNKFGGYVETVSVQLFVE